MITLCQTGIGLLAASVVVSMLSTQGKKQLMASMTPEQRAAYNEIARSRLMVYIVSLGIGGVAGWLFVQGAGGAELGWHSLCAGVGVSTLVSYIVYKMWPKKRWVLSHLTGNPALGIDAYTQAQLWLEMYKTMSWNFHAGFVVGVLGYAVLLKGMCKGKPP